MIADLKIDYEKIDAEWRVNRVGKWKATNRKTGEKVYDSTSHGLYLRIQNMMEICED